MFNKIIIFCIIIITCNSYCVLSIHYGPGDGIKTKVATRENLDRNYNAFHQNQQHNFQQGSEAIGMHHQYSQVRSYRSGSESNYQSQSHGPEITTSMLPPSRGVQERQISYQEYMEQQQQLQQQSGQSGASQQHNNAVPIQGTLNQNVNRNIYQQQATNQNNYDQTYESSNQNAQYAQTTREQRQYVEQPSEKQISYVTECPPDSTGQYPYLMDCRQFLNCWKGRGSIQSCPPGTLFNPSARECDFPNKVTCQSMNNPHSLRTVSGGAHALTARNHVECEPAASGLFPHPYECTKFLNCANGITYIQECGPGTVFNPLFSVCDYPYNVDCGSKTVAPVESNYIDEEKDTYENYRRSNNQNIQPTGSVYKQHGNNYHPSDQNIRTGYGRHNDQGRGTLRHEDGVHMQQTTTNQNHRTNQYDDQISSLNENVNVNQIRRTDHIGTQHVDQSNDDRQISYQFGANEFQSQNRGLEQAILITTTPVPKKWMYPWEAKTSTTTPQTYYRVPELTTTETPTPIYYRQNNLDRQLTHIATQQTTQQQHTTAEQQLSSSKTQYNDENPPWIRRRQKQQTEYNEGPLDLGQQQSTSWDLYQGSTTPEKIILTTTPQPEQSHVQSINRKTSSRHNHQQHRSNQDSLTNQGFYQSHTSETHGNLGTINSSIPLNHALQLLLRPYLNRSGSVTENDMRQFQQSLLPLTEVEKINGNSTIYENVQDVEWNREDGNGDNDEDISGEILTTPQPNVGEDGRYKPTLKSNSAKTQNLNSSSVSFSNRKTTVHERHKNQSHGHHHSHQHFQRDGGHHTPKQQSGEHVVVPYTIRSDELGSSEKNRGKHLFRPRGNHRHHHRHHHHDHHHSNIHYNRFDTTTATNEMHLSTYPFDHNRQIHHSFVPRANNFPLGPQATTINLQPVYSPIPKEIWNHRQHHHYQNHKHNQSHFIPSSVPTIPKQVFTPPLSNSTPQSPLLQNLFPQLPNLTAIPPHKSLTVHYQPIYPMGTFLPPNLPKTDLLPPNMKPLNSYNRNIPTSNSTQPSGIKLFDTMPPPSQNNPSLITITNSSIPSTGVLPLPVNPTTPEVDNTFQYHTNFNNCADSSSFACGNGECINVEGVCDGKSDCRNRKDERSCDHIGYEIRLSSDSGNTHEGRVEIKVYGVWGYICDDKFGMRDADVLCHELGFELGASEVRANSFYSPHVNVSTNGNPIFLMDEIDCLGNETSLRECNFNGWGVHDCNPEEVVGVVCKIPVMACPLNYWLCDTSKECIPTSFLCDNVPDCADGSDEQEKHCQSSVEVRLVGGIANIEGRLEIKYRGIWGTVCDDDFTNREATVVCRTLGNGGPAFSVKGGFGPGTGQIWLDQVNCIGNETSLEHCTHWAWGEHNCAHSEDVGIRCTPGPVLPYVPVIVPALQNSNNLNKAGRNQNLTSDFPEIVYQMQRSSRILPDQCGRVKVPGGNIFEQPNYNFRVIKGSQAPRGQHPWQATIRVRGQGKSAHWCGAVVVSRYHLLTASHCLIGFPKGAYLIRMGDHNSEILESSEVEIFIENIYSHEDFRKGQHMNNDIALVVLKQPVRFNNYIQPICLPPTEVEYEPGMNCTISGWGSIQSGKSTPSVDLRAGTVPILPMELCKQKHVYGTTITEGMFCAGFLDEGVDACDGDSGGPLICMHNGVHTLYGIISWGQHCGYENRPGVYTKVAHYHEWIQQKLNQSMHAYGV